nr:MAG TPA: hypothetical protein [Caudoviricetes sp.]
MDIERMCMLIVGKLTIIRHCLLKRKQKVGQKALFRILLMKMSVKRMR